jgi:hypothetical protein
MPLNAALFAKALGEKQAGPVSEMLSAFNPLNSYLGGGLLGGGAALAMPTRSLKAQAKYDSTDNPLRAVANVLVPGYGAYNGFKRIGAGIRSPEMKAIKADRMRDRARRELDALQRATQTEQESDGAEEQNKSNKSAGWKTEALGAIVNPINLFGANVLGAGAAGLTPTRTLNQQSVSDDSTWSNLFVPGQASYNWFKRIGAATRSPEMLAMRRQAIVDRLERESGMKKEKTTDSEKQSRVYEASESVEGVKPKEVYESHKKCTPGEFGMHKAGAEFAPTVGQGALTGAGLGALIGALRAPKGKMLKYTLGGAGIGGAAGAGSTAMYNLHDSLNIPEPYGSLTRLPATIAAGGLASHLGNKLYDEVEEHVPEKKERKKEDTKTGVFFKEARLRTFGEKLAAGAGGINWQNVMNTGLGGAALGAGLGGLAGLIDPGEDEYGRRRSRLSAALRGALGGGLTGGGAGALLEAYNPGTGQTAMNYGQTAMDYGRNMYQQMFGPAQQAAPKTPEYVRPATTMVPMAGTNKLRAHPGVKTQAQLQAERNQYLRGGMAEGPVFPNAG